MLMDTPESERPLGTPETRYEDDIKTESKEKVMRKELGRVGPSRDQRRDHLDRRSQCKTENCLHS